MKKFITFVSMQPKNSLLKVNYIPVDNEDIVDNVQVYFPISVLVQSYAESDETVSLVCIMESDNDDIRTNYETLKDEMQTICKTKNVNIEFLPVYTDKKENAASHLKVFRELIEIINDGDEIYACCTYGTKSIPVLEMMALNYAYRVRDNVSIKSIAYGKVDRDKGEVLSAHLYDITSLFYMNQLVNTLAEQKVKDPDRVMKSLLGIENDEGQED